MWIKIYHKLETLTCNKCQKNQGLLYIDNATRFCEIKPHKQKKQWS